jgi:hypothetical protein
MLNMLNYAYEESYRSKLKLFSPENLDKLQLACQIAGFRPSKKQLSERHYRSRLYRKLETKLHSDGVTVLEWVRLRILANRTGNYDEIKKAIEKGREAVSCKGQQR